MTSARRYRHSFTPPEGELTLYSEATARCVHCGWTNSHRSQRCRGCARALAHSSAPPPGPGRSTLIGVVTGGPYPSEMTALHHLWFTAGAAAALCERLLGQREWIAPTLGVLVAIALITQLLARQPRRLGRPLQQRAGIWQRLAPLRRYIGMRLWITDDAGERWAVRFLPGLGNDLNVGDPVFANGFHDHDGEFHALGVTNVRTGARQISRLVTAPAIAVASAVAAALTLIP